MWEDSLGKRYTVCGHIAEACPKPIVVMQKTIKRGQHGPFLVRVQIFLQKRRNFPTKKALRDVSEGCARYSSITPWLSWGRDRGRKPARSGASFIPTFLHHESMGLGHTSAVIEIRRGCLEGNGNRVSVRRKVEPVDCRVESGWTKVRSRAYPMRIEPHPR